MRLMDRAEETWVLVLHARLLFLDLRFWAPCLGLREAFSPRLGGQMEHLSIFLKRVLFNVFGSVSNFSS